jgi:hypothetical protein
MKGITDSRHYEDIADAIRAKNGKESKYYPSEMAAAILAIQGTGEGGESGGGTGGKEIASLNIYENIGMFAIEYEDGSTNIGNATFDADGLPTGLTDDNGNTVNFTSGYPTSATNGENSVPIVWG